MSMTYYAVTDDPNELAHWGIKGMKWGVRHDKPRHTGSRPRSIAYKKAQDKLSKMMKNGIKKAETKWKVYNSPENKQLRAAKRYHNQTERALEKARKGKLKYGKLDDFQIQRITERLAMENQARQLSDREKTFGKRLRESIGQGIISGVGAGAATIASEFVGRRSKLKTDRLRGEQQEELELHKAKSLHKQQKAFERQENSRSNQRSKAKEAVRQEYYQENAKRGYTGLNAVRNLNILPGQKAHQLKEWKAKDAKEEERRKRQNAYIDAYTKTYAAQRAMTNVGIRNANAINKYGYKYAGATGTTIVKNSSPASTAIVPSGSNNNPSNGRNSVPPAQRPGKSKHPQKYGKKKKRN